MEYKPPSEKRALAVIFLTVMADLIGFGIILPQMPLYTRCFGQNAFMAGLLFASYSAMQFIFAPFWGRVSDRIGRRPVLLISIGGNILALLVFGLATNFWWLLVARSFAGMCTANISVAQAYIADISPPEKRAARMGLVGAAFGIGFVIGPVVGGELAQFGLAFPPFAAAGLAALNFVAAGIFLPESLAPEHRARKLNTSLRARFTLLQKIPGLAALLLLLFASVFAFSMLEMAFSLFVVDRLTLHATEAVARVLTCADGLEITSSHFSVVGRLFGFIGIIMVIVQGGLIGPLTRKFHERGVAQAGLLFTALGMLALPFTPLGSYAMLISCIGMVATGQALLSPTLSSTLSRRTASTEQGAVLGLSQSASALARTLGPLIAGMLYEGINENWPFWIGGVLMLGAWLLAIRVLRQE